MDHFGDHHEREDRVTLELYRRQISDEQKQKFEVYIAEIFTALGLDLDTAATRETPQRFV